MTTNENKPNVTCPHCGKVNAVATAFGHVEGPREYHADCWEKASANMTDEQIREAWDNSPLPA